MYIPLSGSFLVYIKGKGRKKILNSKKIIIIKNKEKGKSINSLDESESCAFWSRETTQIFVTRESLSLKV